MVHFYHANMMGNGVVVLEKRCEAAKMRGEAAKIDQPMHAANVWNLDTGAGHDGKLTIMDVDTKQFWQSDAVTALYEPVSW